MNRSESVRGALQIALAVSAVLAVIAVGLLVFVLVRKRLKRTVRKKVFVVLLSLLLAASVLVGAGSFTLLTDVVRFYDLMKVLDPQHAGLYSFGKKPVIYLYPEEERTVSVKLDLDGELTSSYPAYGDGWQVIAQPDGTLRLPGSSRDYYCLFWEGLLNAEYDFSQGFVVPGGETEAFLEDALKKLGLTDREAEEFIIYWLPQMEGNPYNLISFQTTAYTESAKLSIDPAPDTLIRVFMAWKPLDAPVDLPPQELTAPARDGFTTVEWGGGQVE